MTIPLLTSPNLTRLGVPHGFTTRVGGVSQGPFASLNLGRTFGGGDDPARIAQNLALVAGALSVDRITHVYQVHGSTVLRAQDVLPTSEADGILLTTPGEAALVTVADCAPVLLARRDGTAVAAVHAGWRGAVARIASLAVKALGGDVVAAIGPCIGPCCFEVGPEVVEAAHAVAGERVIHPGRAGKPHVDLAGIVLADLLSAGLARQDVDLVTACTVCDARFFSHRRDKGLTGRQAGVVGLTRRLG
jgi:YfiH family protein